MAIEEAGQMKMVVRGAGVVLLGLGVGLFVAGQSLGAFDPQKFVMRSGDYETYLVASAACKGFGACFFTLGAAAILFTFLGVGRVREPSALEVPATSSEGGEPAG
jgi:hypothetical protein